MNQNCVFGKKRKHRTLFARWPYSLKNQNNYLPSPKPKHGIRLSSSKGDKVRPIIEIACSYGLGVSPIAWRDLRLKEYLPITSCQNPFSPREKHMHLKTSQNMLEKSIKYPHITCPFIAFGEINTKN